MSSSTAEEEVESLSNTRDIAVTVETVFKLWGLAPNVFYADEARKEAKLDDVMKPPLWFYDVLGTVHNTDFLVVVGERGAGKSALRRYIGQQCEQLIAVERLLGGKVLCVNIDHDVPFWVERATTSKRPLAAFCADLCDLIAAGIAGRVKPEVLRKLHSVHQATLARFVCRLQRKSPAEANVIWNATQSQPAKVYKAFRDFDLVQDLVKVFTGSNLEASADHAASVAEDAVLVQDVVELTEVAVACGFDAVYVLVDELDEYQQVGRDARKAAELVAPIIGSLQLLESPRIAFKFFLSGAVFAQLEQVCSEGGTEIRWDRTTHFEPFRLTWEEADIRDMLELRLRAYSLQRDPPVTTLRGYCAEDITEDVDQVIAEMGYHSPRQFIKFAHHVAVQVARTGLNTRSRITRQALDAAMKAYSSNSCKELYSVPYVNALVNLGRAEFWEQECVETLGVAPVTCQNMLRDMVARGALHVTEDLKGRHYEVTDPRLRYLVANKIVL